MLKWSGVDDASSNAINWRSGYTTQSWSPLGRSSRYHALWNS